MRFVLSSLFVALVVCGPAKSLLACSCAPPPPPKKALEGSVAVFLGKVTAVEADIIPVEIPGEPAEASFTGFVDVTFAVETNYKGVKTKKVTVRTASDGAMCGYGFTKDEVYLVYCYGKPDKLSTGLCTRTSPASRAKADLDALGEGEAVEE